MCILSYLPADTPADEHGLYYGGLNNPHGHGWAIVADDDRRIIIGKSMDLDKAVDRFVEARKENMRGPALFHSRWATHGSKKLDNVHPFQVNGSAQTVVAHNGILRPAAWPGKGDDRSDTRIFADDILMKQFHRLDRPGTQKALAQWCTGNKLVILTVDRRYQCSSYIVNQKMGQWDPATGIWHSNGDYKSYAARGYHYGYGYESEAWPTVIGKKGTVALEDIDDARCLWCDMGDVDERGYCKTCWCCADCAEHIDDCQCYQGKEHEAAELSKWEDEVAAYDKGYPNVIDVDAKRWQRAN